MIAIQKMFEEKIGSQMRNLKKYHEKTAESLRDIHKNDRTEGHNERVNFYDQILEEIRETAEVHARRMAEVLRAMYADRMEAEKRRREAGTENGAAESEMIRIDSIIETQQRNDIETLEKFALTLLISHPEGEDTIMSGVGQLINIWNGQKTTSERTNQMHAANERRGPRPPPEAGYSERCECGRGREARSYLICDRKWICYDCTEDRKTGGFGGFGGSDTGTCTPPPPPDEAPSEQEDAEHLGIENGEGPATELNVDNERFLARHGCRCRSGGAATLSHSVSDEFRCKECVNYEPVEEDNSGSETQQEQPDRGREEARDARQETGKGA